MDFKKITYNLIKELDKIDITPHKIRLNKQFYNDIISLFKSIKLEDNHIEYNKINIKTNINYNFISILNYFYKQHLLNNVLSSYPLDKQNEFIEIIKNNDNKKMCNWINLNGINIMRRLNLLLKSYQIPNNIFNNNLDKDIINEFVEYDILDYLINNIQFKHEYKIHYKNIIINLGIYSNKSKIVKSKLLLLVKLILLIGLYKHNNSKQINIDIFMTPFTKKISKNSVILGPKEINTGFTSPNYKLCVYRDEELNKVLIHELIHYLNLDLGNVNPNKIANYFNINPNIEIRLNEAYTEILALMINISINSYLYNNRNNYNLANKMLNSELKFTLFQIGKILNHYNFNSSYDFFKSYNSELFKQNTGVFSYFIIKGLLLYNINDYLSKLHLINKDNFITMILHYYDKEYINIVNKFLTYIRENKNKHKLIFYNLRLSLFEM